MEGPVSDNLTQSTARLVRLVSDVMKETDPVRYDQLADEIWHVLEERERFIKQNPDTVIPSSDPPIKKIV